MRRPTREGTHEEMQGHRSTRTTYGMVVALIGTVIALATIGCHGANSNSNPNKTGLSKRDKRAIVSDTRAFSDVPIKIMSIKASKSTTGWARVVTDYSDIMFHSQHGRWKILKVISSGKRDDGVCAYGPQAVVRDLYGISCPGERALHARFATKGERKSLVMVFRSDPLTRSSSRGMLMGRACISRINSTWASAIEGNSGGGGPFWFHRVSGRWQVAYTGYRGARPTHAVILSLAFCVGYDAAQFGG